MNLNIEFDSNALAAPDNFRNAILTAASFIDRAFVDNITVNIVVGYGEFNGSTLTDQRSAQGLPAAGLDESYSAVRSLLISRASPGDTTFDALPSGTSIQGQSNVAVWNAQLKALGLLSPNNSTIDGYVGFGTQTSPSLWVEGALHELTHALGRVYDGPEPDIFDLFRFTSPGTRLFAGSVTSPPAYFSVDGGFTDLADYGRTADPADFLNPPISNGTPDDSFNEFGESGTFQYLTAVDVLQMEALGFHLASVAKLDFSLDGTSDILWRNSSGALAAWDLSGGAISGAGITSNGVVVAPDASWSVAGISDFDGDGKADILWRNANGNLADWSMNGAAVASSGYLASNGTIAAPDASWNITGVGDLDGDGKSDIIWRNSGGALVGWLMNGPTITSSGFLNVNGATITLDASWNTVGVGDFNGDGRADLMWRSSATGEIALWSMNGTSIGASADVTSAGVVVRPDPSWSVVGTGDFNGDHNADLLWRNTNGSLVEWLMNGSTIIGSGVLTYNGSPVAPDLSWKVVEIGEFNGHGVTDILWRSNTGALAEWEMNGASLAASLTPTSNGAVVSPDVSWSPQAKPTIYS